MNVGRSTGNWTARNLSLGIEAATMLRVRQFDTWDDRFLGWGSRRPALFRTAVSALSPPIGHGRWPPVSDE